MKKITVILLLGLLLMLAACGEDPAAPTVPVEAGQSGTAATQPQTQQQSKYAQIIATAGVESVTYEVLENNGTQAEISANVPDYTQMLTAAMETEDPEKTFAEAITAGGYNTVVYTGTVDVIKDSNGEETLDTEKLLKFFVEQELIKAVNAVTENEEGVTVE